MAEPRGLTPLVGRESEVTLLLAQWEHAKAGHGQVVLYGRRRDRQITVSPPLESPCRPRAPCTVGMSEFTEYYQNTALFPSDGSVSSLLQWQPNDTLDEKRNKLEHALSQYRLPLEDTVPLFAPLLSLPLPEERYPPLHMSPQRQRQKTLETIVAILLELAERQPVLFIVEDLHWTDPTTLELLHLMIEQIPTASILTVLTCRPHFQPAWHHRSSITEMTLNHLSHAQVEQIVTGMTNGKTFPTEVLQQIIAKTDGVPLLCGRNHQGHSGIGTAHSRRWALRTHRIVLHVRHSCHASRFVDGTPRSSGHGESGGAVCGSHRAAVFLCVAPGGLAIR